MLKKLGMPHLLASALMFGAMSAMAGGYVKGQVEFIRTHDATAQPAWAPPRFWFTLKGVTQAGTCTKWVSGTVMFVANDKQALTTVMTAQATGQEIAVAFDETVLTNTHCSALYLTIGNPAPAY
jgi:hypothetical protein